MKKMPVVIACFALVIFPYVVSGQERLTGHIWRTMPKEMKVFLIAGFKAGYQLGRQEGYLLGTVKGMEWVESKVCKEEVEATCVSVRKTTKDKATGAERLMLGLGGITSFQEKTEYHMNQLEAFYEAFPLCRGEDVFLVLVKLVWIWAGTAETSYNKIGAECGERGNK